VSEQGVKVYEYNADSASGLMECGKVQGKWARHFGCEAGRCSGGDLRPRLARAWKRAEIEGVLHILRDSEPEEVYHALFMKEAIESAGIECRIVEGLSGISWGAGGEILDDLGIPIRRVWKTWAWETVVQPLRAEGALPCGSGRRGAPPRLLDILLRPGVKVYEPLWTLIPSNKAILPVLWEMFPNHPHLLDSSFSLTEGLRSRGYVAKPIVGRCGSNIGVFDGREEMLEKTPGKFGGRDRIYQEFWRLPSIDGCNLQVSAFTVYGSYAGCGVRIDRSLVIRADSDFMPLRTVADESMVE
jgi:glutathionylspermidine amidase/synthetase